MQKKVFQFIKEQNMIESGDRIVAGISGGADSVALFHLLLEYGKQADFVWCAVYVNHKLRPGEAERDRDFVQALCQRFQVPFICIEKNVAEMANEKKISVEEAGRIMRQRAFREQMEHWEGSKIALAHHMNDTAETMIHHLCRGTGLGGLCGIHPVQGQKIRPLLCLERWEIEHYLKERGETYVIDSTNAGLAYTRNRIRHLVLPRMVEEVNPQTVSHMAGTARQLQKALEYLKQQAQELLKEYSAKQETGILLKQGFFAASGILQEYGVMELLYLTAGTKKDVTEYHIRQVLSLGVKEVGKVIELPGNRRARRLYDGVLIEKQTEPAKINKRICEESDADGWKLVVPGETIFPQGRIVSRVFPNSGEHIPEKMCTKWLSYDNIKDMLYVRTRREGDYLTVNSTGGHKRLKDYFIDCKIPRELRNEIPLLVIGREVVWVTGHRIGEAFKVDENTREILEVTYEGGEDIG